MREPLPEGPPATFDGIVGARNKEVAKSVGAVVAKPDPPHAFLLTGPSGCGKTTFARIIARELGCAEADFREVDSADFRGIDTVREMRRGAQYKALGGERRVWLIDEVHRMTNDAQNALLKGLEDPPPHCFYVLATTEPDRLLPTIVSRCVRYEVSPLTDDEMLRFLHRTASHEGAPLPRATLQRVVEVANGAPRAALNALEVLIADPEAGEAALVQAAAASAKAIDLCRALMELQGWKSVAAILADLRAEDVESVRRAVLGYCTAILFKGENDVAAEVMDQFVAPFYDSGHPGLVHACYVVVRGRAA